MIRDATGGKGKQGRIVPPAGQWSERQKERERRPAEAAREQGRDIVTGSELHKDDAQKGRSGVIGSWGKKLGEDKSGRQRVKKNILRKTGGRTGKKTTVAGFEPTIPEGN